MTTSSDLDEYSDELTKCPICLHDVDNPKLLPCFHAFCLLCIRDHYRDASPGDRCYCPVCRNAFTLPEKGIEQLPSNFFIKGLVDIKRIKPGDKVPCEVCLRVSDEDTQTVSIVTKYCITCGQKLCDDCSKPHVKFLGSTHQIVTLGSEVREELLKSQGNFCSLHPGNCLEIYCVQCKVNTCCRCLAIKHKGHECQDISDIFESCRQTILRKTEEVSAQITSGKQSREQPANVKALLEKIQYIQAVIMRDAYAVKKHVDDAVTQAVQQLSIIKEGAPKAVVNTKVQLDSDIAAKQIFLKFSRELIKHGKPYDITHVYQDLITRADDLLKHNALTSDVRLPDITIASTYIFDKVYEFIARNSTEHANKRQEQTVALDSEIIRLKEENLKLTAKLLESEKQTKTAMSKIAEYERNAGRRLVENGREDVERGVTKQNVDRDDDGRRLQKELSDTKDAMIKQVEAHKVEVKLLDKERNALMDHMTKEVLMLKAKVAQLQNELAVVNDELAKKTRAHVVKVKRLQKENESIKNEMTKHVSKTQTLAADLEDLEFTMAEEKENHRIDMQLFARERDQLIQRHAAAIDFMLSSNKR